MNTAPDPADIARLVALAEEGLRRSGFAESTIKRRRKVTRDLITAHLTREDPR